MASSAGTIKEFLIALGFKVDEASFSKFDTGIGRATKISVGLGTAIVATATAVEAAVVRIARQFETLYYTSARTGASVASLQSWTYASRQIGIAADASRGAVEGLARAMRSSPGVAQLLNQLGIKTAGRDTTQILHDFIGQMRKLPFYLAAQYGQMIGIDPDTLLMLEQGYERLADAQEDYAARQKAAGIDAGDLAGRSTEFSRKLERLDSDFGILGQRIEEDFLGPIEKGVEVVDSLVQSLNNLDGALHGAVGWIGAVGAALGSWFAAKGAKSLLGRLLSGGAAAATAAGATGGEGTAGAIAAAGAGWLARLTGVGTFLSAFLYSTPANAGEDEMARQARYGSAGIGGRTPLGVRNNNPGNLRPPGASTGFQKFPTALAGLSALAGQLLRYGDRGLDTLDAIITRWAPPSENDTSGYIGDAARRTGFDPNQKLNLRDPTVLQRVMDAIIRHENGFNPYSADLERAAINARLGLPNVALAPSGGGGRAVTINQKTDINVNGAGDARAVAGTVVGQQNRVNADIVRNMSGVIR